MYIVLDVCYHLDAIMHVLLACAMSCVCAHPEAVRGRCFVLVSVVDTWFRQRAHQRSSAGWGTLALFSGAAARTQCLQAAFGMASDCVLWLGNIPGFLCEQEVLAELAAYMLRPVRILLRRRRPGEEPLHSICAFTTMVGQPYVPTLACPDHQCVRAIV